MTWIPQIKPHPTGAGGSCRFTRAFELEPGLPNKKTSEVLKTSEVYPLKSG